MSAYYVGTGPIFSPVSFDSSVLSCSQVSLGFLYTLVSNVPWRGHVTEYFLRYASFSTSCIFRSIISGGIASCGANDSACSYTFLRSVVCRLSVVCHIRAPCLNRWWIYMPFDSYICGVQWTLCLMGYLTTRESGDLGVRTPGQNI